jgi:hypothetical protein
LTGDSQDLGTEDDHTDFVICIAISNDSKIAISGRASPGKKFTLVLVFDRPANNCVRRFGDSTREGKTSKQTV